MKYYQREIPETCREQYISGRFALNVPGETSGDWHFTSVWLSNTPNTVELWGKNQKWDTNDIFGDFGIEDKKDVLVETGLVVKQDRVYVANHFRAILDLIIAGAIKNNMSLIKGATSDYLDTEEQKAFLLDKVLNALNSKSLSLIEKACIQDWIIDERRNIYRGEIYGV